MNPIDLIKQHLGEDAWQRGHGVCPDPTTIVLDEDSCVFTSYRIYGVRGGDRQFDFPTLPYGSYGYYAANGREAVRLTRAGKEIQTILAKEWPSFAQANPVRLASLILCFFDGGILASHHVLADADDLRSMCQPPREFHLDEQAFATALPELGVTSCRLEGNEIVLRAITLLGWMHDKRNLGIETLTIHENGAVALSQRRVLAENVFERVPGIMY
jgi:hypothetical protein